jgi:hypothetical protein
VGAVTLDTSIVSIGCAGTGEEGSSGLGGGFTVAELGDTTLIPLPFVGAAAPTPGTLPLLGFALAGLIGFARRR